MAAQVQIRGIRELRSAFKRVDAEIPKELRKVLKDIALSVVAGIAAKVPRVSGKAARSVRARSSQTGAAIAVGGATAPYYPWLDFGGTVGRGHRPGVPWSGSVHRDMPVGGRYVYPTIAEKRDDIDRAVEAALVRASHIAGFEVR